MKWEESISNEKKTFSVKEPLPRRWIKKDTSSSGQEKLQKKGEVPQTIGFDVLLLQLFELVFDGEVMGHLYYQPELYILIKITLPSTMLMKWGHS